MQSDKFDGCFITCSRGIFMISGSIFHIQTTIFTEAKRE
jgi:hypothetical protein